MKKEIPIFFTIDNSYAPYISVAIKSIIENASKNYNYKIVCKCCKQEFYRQRLSKNFTRKYRCAKCGSSFEVSRLVEV